MSRGPFRLLVHLLFVLLMLFFGVLLLTLFLIFLALISHRVPLFPLSLIVITVTMRPLLTISIHAVIGDLDTLFQGLTPLAGGVQGVRPGTGGGNPHSCQP